MISKAQLKKVYTLIRQQNLDEMKDSLVHQHTNGRTTHVTEMEVQEVNSLIKVLLVDDPLQKMKNKAKAIAHDLGWTFKGMHEFNEAVISKFLLARGVVKKPLHKLSKDELRQVVTQLELVLKHKEHSDFKMDLHKMLDEFHITSATRKKGRNQH